jgi:hypothetical protein
MIDPELFDLILLGHAGVTCGMTGLIWFVQVVHYPLFSGVGRADFGTYEQQHARRTGWVVAVPMLAELALAVALVWQTGGVLEWCALGLLGTVWFSTAIWQIPMHRRLESGFDVGFHRRLVTSNWVRTVAWSLRGVLSLMMLA